MVCVCSWQRSAACALCRRHIMSLRSPLCNQALPLLSARQLWGSCGSSEARSTTLGAGGSQHRLGKIFTTTPSMCQTGYAQELAWQRRPPVLTPPYVRRHAVAPVPDVR